MNFRGAIMTESFFICYHYNFITKACKKNNNRSFPSAVSHPIISIFNAMSPPDSALSVFVAAPPPRLTPRGELLIPQCVPTGRVVLVLKQRDLAKRGKTASRSGAYWSKTYTYRDAACASMHKCTNVHMVQACAQRQTDAC